MEAGSPSPAPRGRQRIWTLLRILLPVLVLVLGYFLADILIKTAPKAERQPPPRQARLVEVDPIKIGNHRTLVHASGTVQPAREVALQSRVSGQVVAVNEDFFPGGNFREGQTLIQIDRTDFELIVRHRESEVAQARMELALELGLQAVAKREAELLGGAINEGDRALMLRQPQLERVQARLRSTEAALTQAKLDLERATVRAPFNATVRGRTVNIGMQVTPSTTLATLTGTDKFWVEAAVPVDQLKWFRIPGPSANIGSPVRIFTETAWGEGNFRSGRVIRLLSELDKEGRMARVLIEVDDPQALLPANAGKPKLLLNDFVRVEIEGIDLPQVAAVARHLVRDGNRIWLMNEQGELEIREVEIAFSGREYLLIRNGLAQGEKLVVTDISAPMPGMPLRTAKETPRGSAPPDQGKTGRTKPEGNR